MLSLTLSIVQSPFRTRGFGPGVHQVGGPLWKSADDACSSRRRCHATFKPSIQEHNVALVKNGLPVEETTELCEESPSLEVLKEKDIPQLIKDVKQMLISMDDGEITSSAYDTAWVALVQDVNGGAGPQFPSSLQWIVANQLNDGSWGDEHIFSPHDRLINTLACVVALKSWSISPQRCERGMTFVRENMWRLSEEDEEHMPIGFEVVFPPLMEIANTLGLQVPYDDPALQNIYAMRNRKLKKIPLEVMHAVPTSLLHSIAGMPGLDWDKLLKLQSRDGSFLFSPASTAYALMQTKDLKCLQYLEKTVSRFNGGVPGVYPVDMFEHLWAVDRLHRLGISRYFESEIKDCLDYVYRYWTEDGICWARNSAVNDADDTAMGFRLLRLHGYNVSPNVLKQFEKDDEFFCFAGQSNQAVTGMYNLHRASHVAFPGEAILERVKSFTYKFLKMKQASNELLDKWIITKDLPGEVEYALDFPFFASLPRIETRLYVDQYGGEDDVWIGKTLYRMPFVNNAVYLELAKRDFNECQVLHQREWLALQKWHTEFGLDEHGLTREMVLQTYFLATASIFQPDRAAERLGWARTMVVADAISSFLGSDSCSDEKRCKIISDLLYLHDPNVNGCIHHARSERKEKPEDGLVRVLLCLIDDLAAEALPAQRKQKRITLRHAWEEWLRAWPNEGATALLLIRIIEACAGRDNVLVAHPEYTQLVQVTSSVCGRLSALSHLSQMNKEGNGAAQCGKDMLVEQEMQELLNIVLRNSDLDKKTKQTFLTIAKSYYYMANCPISTIEDHITKVLFQQVI